MENVVDENLSVSNTSSESSKVASKPPKPTTDASNSKKTDTSVKRPANPFILWSRDERKTIMKEGILSGWDISRELSQRWKNLSDEIKEQYINEANKLRWEFLQQYPDIKFQRTKAPKLKKVTVKTPVKKTKQLKKTAAIPKKLFDPRSTAIPVNKLLPSVFKPSIKKPLSGSSPLNQDSQYQIQFKIDENFSSDFDSVLDKSMKSLELYKFLKLKPDKTVEISQTSLSIDELPSSGDICRIALKSHDCIETFDFVSDFVLKNAGNLTEMVCDVVKEYNDLAFSHEELKSPLFDSPDYKVPTMSELIGEEWMLPSMGFEHLP